jgi:hypothetical protein
MGFLDFFSLKVQNFYPIFSKSAVVLMHFWHIFSKSAELFSKSAVVFSNIAELFSNSAESNSDKVYFLLLFREIT